MMNSENTESCLRKSEEKFLKLTNAISEAIIIMEDGKATEVNNKFTEIFGFSLKDLAGDEIHSFLPPKTINEVLKNLGFQEEPYETLGLKKDGTLFDIEITCKRVDLPEQDLRIIAIRDISKRKKMQRELDLMAQFVQFNPGPVFRLDKNGNIQTANNAALDLFQFNLQQQMGIRDVIPEMEMTDFAGCIQNNSHVALTAKVGEKYFQFTLKGVSKMGIANLYGADVTESKESEDRFKAIISSANDAIIMMCGYGTISVWNDAAENIFGYKREEVLGKSMADFIIPQQYKEGHIQGVKNYKKTGEVKNIGKRLELSALRKNGEEFPIEISYAKPVSLKGQWHAVAIIRDITERKQLEDELKTTLSKMEIILEGAGVGISLVINGKVVWGNSILSEIFRGTLEDIYGQGADVILASGGLGKEEQEKGLSQLMQGKSFQLETMLKRQDGSLFWGRLLGKAVDPTNLASGVIYIIEDISERKKMMEELHNAKEKAVQANKAKSMFLSSMSHELRTPLNSIIGFTELMEMDSDVELSDSQKENVEQVLKSSNHLLSLINEVLDLAQIESGLMSISLETVAIYPLIEETLATIDSIAAKKRITINIYKERDAEIYVTADSTRLKQALLNLLSNGVKYNNKEGKVTVSVEKSESQSIRILVEDTGPGIPAEKLKDLFEPFNRLGAENLDVEGTGIGLTITRKLMKIMDGGIDVESEVGVGTKFILELPKADKPNLSFKVENDENETFVSHNQKTLLYIEDNPANLMLIEKILSNRPKITLISASTAGKGLELALSERPDLILMDINLPDMNGYEALKVLQENAKIQGIPVAAISANAMRSDLKQAKMAGFIEYIVKPINVKKFLTTIDLLLSNNNENDDI